MTWLRRLIWRLRTPRDVRLAMDKRRLERVAQQAGAPRAMAVTIASRFFRNDLEDVPK
jgi:hypothetical protein